MIFYRDSSKREQGSDAGIYRVNRRTKTPTSLGTYVTVFQVEIAAIVHCTIELLRRLVLAE